MQLMNKFITFLIILSMILFFSGCNTDIENKNNVQTGVLKGDNNTNSTIADEKVDNMIIDEVLSFLTSDECHGRLPGTKGNQIAQEYIKEKFEEVGLIPYEGTFYHDYQQSIPFIIQKDIKLSLNDSEGQITTFEHGKDFLEQSLFKAILEFPVCLEPNDKDSIIAVKDAKKISELSDKENVKGILLVTNKLSKNIMKHERANDKPIFRITKNVYKILQENLGKKVTMTMNYEINEVKMNNILGMIPGKNSTEAIIISAHLDHVGGIDNKIWRGAIDNASGVSVLLDIAKKVNESVSRNELNGDIIFCAFNSEEAGLIGSKYVSNYLNEKYTNLININIDCIGEKNKELLIDSKDENTIALAKQIKQLFEKNKLKASTTVGQYPSDHRSFNKGINISTDIKNSPIHTLDDTKDKLDIEYMEIISENLSNFIIEYAKEIESQVDSTKQDIKKIHERLEREQKELKYGEYKQVMIDDKEYLVMNTNFSGDLEELRKIYNNNFEFVPSTVSGCDLMNVQVTSFRSKNSIVKEELEIDKIYKEKVLTKNINRFSIMYRNEESFEHVQIGVNTFSNKDKGEVLFKNNYLVVNNFNTDNDNQIKIEKYCFYFQEAIDNSPPSLLLIKDYDDITYIFTFSIFFSDIEKKEDFLEIIKDNNLEVFIDKTIQWLRSGN